jgi:hypothetical protein
MSTGGRGNTRILIYLVDEDPAAIAALKQCGLWKFFRCPFMRAQPRLLNTLVDYWHPDAEAFYDRGAVIDSND